MFLALLYAVTDNPVSKRECTLRIYPDGLRERESGELHDVDQPSNV